MISVCIKFYHDWCCWYGFRACVKILALIFEKMCFKWKKKYYEKKNSTKHITKHTWVERIQVCSNKGPRPFPRRDRSENVKLYWKYFKIFFFRTTWPISTKRGIKHPWVEGIQVCSNAGLRPSSRGDISEIVNFYSKYFKIFFSRTAWPI